MRKRVSGLLAILLVIALVLPLAAVSAQEDAVVLRYPINPDPEHLNPFTATTIAIGVINRNIYEGLFKLDDATGEIEPWLAESYDVSEDRLTYTFHLRQGVLFQEAEGVTYDDGDREYKAEDYIWAAQILDSDDETVSQHADDLSNIVGAAEFRAGEADTISGITAVDDYTIEVQLVQADRLFPLKASVPAVPREAYEQLGEEFNTRPVGTGPFMFVEWLRDDHITVTANPDYWQEGMPMVDGIEFINVADANTQLLLYRENELDFLFSFPTGQVTAVREEFADEIQSNPGLNVRYFGFDMEQGFFAEHPLVRQAFAHSFNRDLVWNELMEGSRFPGDLGVLPPLMPASTPATIYEYNLERAAELLDEAGFPLNEETGLRDDLPAIELYVFGSARDELSFPVLQADLGSIGVRLLIVIEDNSTYWNHIGEDDVIFFLSGWSAGQPDPSDVLDFLFLDGRDDTHYNNPEVNDLLRAAQAEYDDDARNELYQQAHDLIMADAPWIVSAYSRVEWAQKPWIQGFTPGGGGTYTARLWEVSVDASMMP